MPKNGVRKTFERWLAHSAGRFHHPPRTVLQRKRYIELQFAGITPAIRCTLGTEGMVGIYASYQGEWWDGLADFDVVARRMSTGQYYCHLCTSPELFPSRAALWVAHCFEPLLAWANDHLQPSQWLCLFGEPDDATWAELMPAADVSAARLRNHFVEAYPVVCRRRRDQRTDRGEGESSSVGCHSIA